LKNEEGNQHPKKHKFAEEEFEKVLNRIPESLKYLEFHKLYLYSVFWQNFYITAKYGLERFRVGPDRLFEKEEAKLALKMLINVDSQLSS